VGFRIYQGLFPKQWGKHKIEERGKIQKKKELVVCFAIACWAMALTVWLLNRRLVHMDIRSFLVF